ncbi:MAG TPA: hypothetical protein VFE24_08250 [Pirellulales bacterium]|jgi:hypothetical protein|nr:hypothetical protein [Pirellulales bacterium]
MMDYEVQRCTRTCAISGRELKPGETFYSVLQSVAGEVVRQDYAAEAWPGPPEQTIGWWKSQIPLGDPKRVQWAPNEVMLELFEELENQPAQHDFRYVLSLLLVRRRVLRLEETEQDAADQETLLLNCPKRETEYRVAVVMPSAARAAEIQAELKKLLWAKG